MNVKVKRLSWAGNRADNLICSYVVESLSFGIYKPLSPTFQWYPDKQYHSKRQAMEACQRHYEKIVRSLFEVGNEEQ